jgi:hypothetical protein
LEIQLTALEAGLKLSSKALVVAGGEGLTNAYSAEDALNNKPNTHANGWIFYKNEKGGLDTEGLLFT